MNYSVEQKTYANAYVKLENDNNSVTCQAISEINPSTFDAGKMLTVIETLKKCLQSEAEIIAVKKVNGKKFVVH